MRKILIGVGLAVLTLGGGAAVVAAQTAPPTVALTVGNRAIVGAQTVAAGPTRLEFRVSRRREASLTVFALKPGVTVDQFRAALPRLRSPESALRYGTFEAGGGPKRGSFATTLTLRTGQYLVLNTAAESPRNFAFGSFTVGQPGTPVTAPTADATVTMRDYRFTGSRSLPRRGTVRFENRGRQAHFAFSARLRRGVSETRALRAARSRSEDALERVVIPTSFYEVDGVQSPGASAENELNFGRAGRYLLVCFLDGGPRNRSHNQLGMERVVRVR